MEYLGCNWVEHTELIIQSLFRYLNNYQWQASESE
jgi:hypothetical protein